MKHHYPFCFLMAFVIIFVAPMAPPIVLAQDAAPIYLSAEKLTVPATESPQSAALFLSDEDILSWEENQEGKYIYFAVTEKKNTELATLTKAYLGQPITINLENIIVRIPMVNQALSQKNGFVLKIAEGQRDAMRVMLNRDKQVNATAAIQLPLASTAGAPETTISETKATLEKDKTDSSAGKNTDSE